MIAQQSPSDELQISAPDKKTEVPELVDLLCKTYSAGSGYWNAEKGCRNGYLLKSNYDWNASRIGKRDGLIITHFGIWKFQIRVGLARLCVAGVGAVATHDRYRKMGLMRATATAALEGLRESEYDISLLFGIPNFYEQFGYRRAWTQLVATIETNQISENPMPGKLDRSRLAGRVDLITLYNKENATLTGTAVRPTFPLGNPFAECDAYLWKRGQAVKGFVFVSSSKSSLDVKAWAGDPDEILTVVKRLAVKRCVTVVQFQSIHYQSQLARFLRRKDCTFKSEFRASGGPMIRTISLPRSVKRLKPELEDRLRKSHLADWCGDLLLDNSREAVTLRIDRGKIQVAKAERSLDSISGNEAIAQLLLGTDEPNEIIEAGGIKLRGEARALAAILFPNEYPALSAWDRF